MELIKCQRCGKEIVKRNKQHKYCTKCSSIINREMTKQRHKQK